MTSAATIRYGDAELLAAVRAVALALGGTAPEKLSQPQFDRGRATVADVYPGLPTARAIYMRLNSGTGGRVSWASIVRAALAGGVSAQQTIAAARRAAATVPVDRRVLFFALTLVARELGLRTFGPDRYDATASRLRRTRRGALASLLPTANQLVTYAGDWDMALELAELDPRPAAHARPAPVRPDTVPVPEALGLYLQHHGSLASTAELRWFSQAGAFALANDVARPWGEFVAELRAVWTAAGRWCPSKPVLARHRIRYPMPDGGLPGLPARHRVRDRWTLDRCADALVDYWDTLPAGREPKQKPYGAWAVGKADFPAPRSFAQHGGFRVVRDRARERRRVRARAVTQMPSAPGRT